MSLSVAAEGDREKTGAAPHERGHKKNVS